MVFHITFVLALFHDKKCCNCINLFPCILWDLFVSGLALSWWRLLKTVKFATCLRLTYEWTTHKRSHKKHMLEVEESSARLHFASHFATQAMLQVTHETLCPDDFKCDSYILHPYYIYPHYPQSVRRLFRRKP